MPYMLLQSLDLACPLADTRRTALANGGCSCWAAHCHVVHLQQGISLEVVSRLLTKCSCAPDHVGLSDLTNFATDAACIVVLLAWGFCTHHFD